MHTRNPDSVLRRLVGPALAGLIAICCIASPAFGQDRPDLSVASPTVVLDGVPFSVTVRTEAARDATFRLLTVSGREIANGALPIREDVVVPGIEISDDDLPLTVEVQAGGQTASENVTAHVYPGWASILPPLIAIALALIFREVVVSLFFGVWIGGMMIAGLNPLAGLWRSVDTFVVPSLADGDHASIIIFSALLSAMVGVISRSGGTRGIVEAVRPMATTPRRGQLATFLAGIGIFFDDYANTLIVGNTFRPITDRLRISREKLAYLVDSTAAPVVTIVFVSTWGGFQMTLIGDGLQIAASQTADAALAATLAGASPFNVFISSLPYFFYPILALLMVALVVLSQRDFGPMLTAERRARSGGGVFRPGSQLLVSTDDAALEPKEGAPLRWYNAVVPVLTVVVVVVLGLYFDGRAVTGPAPLRDIFGAANPFNAILWGALAGCIVAIGLATTQRILTLKEALDGWLAGVKAMTMGFVILILAWSLGEVTKQVATAPYLTQLLEGNLSPELLPALTFVTAAVVSFCTGTSWATMTVLIPLVIPLILALGGVPDLAGGFGGSLLVITVSSVMAGSIFGDHCSPISDTTVLSSMASACDHMDHVRTQLPYALVVAFVAMAFGHLGVAYGLPMPLAYVLSIATLVALVRFVGKPVAATE